MLYREYREKYQKRLNAFQAIWRFRVLIFLALLLLVAMIAALLGVTGIVYGEGFSETVEYGTPVSKEASAVFRKPYYQFREKGAEGWSDAEPTRVGSYEVRAVAKSIIGTLRSGKAHTYSVVPKKINFGLADTFVYADAPALMADLAYSDRIAETDFTYNLLSEDTYQVSAAVRTVLNEKGEDVTSCYCELEPISKELKMLPRTVVIFVEDAVKEYDGTPLRSEKYRIEKGTIAQGDSLQISFPCSLTAAGELQNEPVISVLKENGQDVTSFYSFKVHAGNLCVNPRVLLLHNESAEKIYDGVSLSNPFYALDASSSLLEGHSLSLTSATEAVNVGEYENKLDFCVFDNDGGDVSFCYRFEFAEKNTLTVKPRPITVRTASKIFIENHGPYTCYDFEIISKIGLAEGHRIDVLSAFSPSEVGSYENRLELEIYDGVVRVTDNYVITYEYGTLRIKEEIVIVLHDVQKSYDGKPLSYAADDYTVRRKPHDVRVEFLITEVGSITDVGVLPMNGFLDFVTVYDEQGRIVNEENAVRFEGRALEVLPRTIEVASATVTGVRSEGDLYGNTEENPAWISMGTLVEGHRIEITLTGVLKSWENGPKENTISQVRIFDEEGKDVTENYKILFRPGILQWK